MSRKKERVTICPWAKRGYVVSKKWFSSGRREKGRVSSRQRTKGGKKGCTPQINSEEREEVNPDECVRREGKRVPVPGRGSGRKKGGKKNVRPGKQNARGGRKCGGPKGWRSAGKKRGNRPWAPGPRLKGSGNVEFQKSTRRKRKREMPRLRPAAVVKGGKRGRKRRSGFIKKRMASWAGWVGGGKKGGGGGPPWPGAI